MAATVGAAMTVQAHPGHAPFSEGTKHFLTSPAHFAPALLFSVALFASAQWLQRRGERAFVRAIAAVITLAAVLW